MQAFTLMQFWGSLLVDSCGSGQSFNNFQLIQLGVVVGGPLGLIGLIPRGVVQLPAAAGGGGGGEFSQSN